MVDFLRNHVRPIGAIAIVAGLYWLTRLPEISLAERDALASQFRFVKVSVPEIEGEEHRAVRSVHPDLHHIQSWISSVGAACSLADLDGDGLPNDMCYVDTRTDRLVVAPVPGTADRYEPFVLDAAPLPWDDATMAPTGCVPGDLNEDGTMDVLVYYWGRTPVAFLRRTAEQQTPDGLSPSEFARCEIAAPGQRWFTNAATRADVDGDGHVDLVLGNYFQDGARILDVNATDDQEMHHTMSRSLNGGHNRLFVWEGGATGSAPTVQYRELRDVWSEEIARGWTLAVGAADLDGDMLPELYFANDFGNDRLLHNRSVPGKPQFALLSGEKRFTTPNSKVLGRDSFKGMGVDFGDLNGDGLLDIYVSNIAEQFALEESHFAFLSTGQTERMRDGVAPYVERGDALGLARSGWGWESRLADFDNDGVLEAIQATGFVKGSRNRWPQLHEAAMGNDRLLRHPSNWHRVGPGDDLSGHNPNPFFVRASDGRFYDLAHELGLDAPQVTRGIATADVDGDGDVDFLLGNQWEASRFYRNECPEPGAYLGLRLMLPLQQDGQHSLRVVPGHEAFRVPSRPAVGAAVTVRSPDGRVLVGQVDGGNGHSGTRSPELHFGLGSAPAGESVRVEIGWRDTRGQILESTLHLKPGWHSILLGEYAESGSQGQVSKRIIRLDSEAIAAHR